MKRLVLPLVVLLGLTGLPGLGATAAVADAPTAGQSVFVPLEPVRLLDTREGTGAARGQVGAGGTVDLRVADGVRVPLDATAVVLNVTATAATAATDVRVYPATGAAPPTVSNLNVTPGSTVANLVHVKVGDGGAVRLRNESGGVHLLADLSGYFVERTSGATYVPVAPRRLLDTRDDRRPLGPGEVRDLPVVGTSAGAPADATAVVLNVTGVGATRQTDIRVWPKRDAEPPTVSNLNPPPGRPMAAAVVVGVGKDSSVSLRSSSGAVHVVVDLAGWYVPTTEGSTFHPVEPVRLLDSRRPSADPRFPAGGAPATPAFRLGPGEAADLAVAGVRGVPAVATAAVLNVTGVAPTATSDVRVYPTGDGSVPGSSNLNVVFAVVTPRSGSGRPRCPASRRSTSTSTRPASATARAAASGSRCAAPAPRPAPAGGSTASGSRSTRSTAGCRARRAAAARWSGSTSRGRTPTGRSGRPATPAPSASTARC